MLSADDIQRLRKKAYLGFYSRPGKILREITNPLNFGRKVKRGFRLLRGKK